MRVSLVSASAPLGNAIGNTVAEKLLFFLERGAEVRVFVESDAALHPALHPYVQTVPDPEPGGDWWAYLASSDVVVFEYGRHYPLLGVLPLLAGAGPRILLDYHGVTPPELWGPHNREALVKGVEQRGLAWYADAVLVHSRMTHRELHEECGLPAERLHQLGFPVDGEFEPAAAGRTPLRRQLGLEDATVLLFVGRLAPNKDAPLLVEALDHLRDVCPPVHVLIVGDTGDLYAEQARLCRERAGELGLGDRLHFAGHRTGAALREAYRAADVFVMPSRWESFCIPVIEAMASGLPVVTARATALPETVAAAGLTFTPGDAADLARQVRRLLPGTAGGAGTAVPRPSRIAIVAAGYGEGPVNGVNRSLRTIAETLQGAGHAVEVFTTVAGAGGSLAPGQGRGVPVHRFAVDPAEEGRLQAWLRALMASGGTERELPKQPLAYGTLLEALSRDIGRFDALIVGPYLSGLTRAVATAFPEKTLLLPCFHDEPAARLPLWVEAYERVAGILYHSRAEQDFAQAELGINHPRATVIGTWLEPVPPGRGERGRKAAGGGRYVVYCGRYVREKGVETLLEYAERYQKRRPGRFRFVFTGGGPAPIPRVPWARDLGVVGETDKRDLLAGADALIQLSPNESLSLIALEAWAEGTPVVAQARCAVLAEHIADSGGGRTVAGFEGFVQALDDLWDNPETWRARGARGQEYVAGAYGCRLAFLERLQQALSALHVPLREQLRLRGLERVASFTRSAWRQGFAAVVEGSLHAEPKPHRPKIEVRRRAATRTVRPGSGTVLLAVRVLNWGTHPVVAEGPGRTVLRCRVTDGQGAQVLVGEDTPLPGLLLPGRARAAAVAVPVPTVPGVHEVELWADCPGRPLNSPPFTTSFRLIVAGEGEGRAGEPSCCTPLLESVQGSLAEAHRLQRLPEDYTDVTQGALARWKRLVKRKLLGNFKHAYVDVLSRQQSAFNRQLLLAVQELVECCATLDHAVRVLQARLAGRGRATKRKRRGKGSRCA